jgi:hypothetical protein
MEAPITGSAVRRFPRWLRNTLVACPVLLALLLLVGAIYQTLVKGRVDDLARVP